jgi:acyl-CoA thioesterase-1
MSAVSPRPTPPALAGLLLASLALAGCGRAEGSAPASAPVTAESVVARLGRQGPRLPGLPRVVFLGDSITSGFGLAPDEAAFPVLVAQRLAAEGRPIDAVLAGVPGSTSAGGLKRLPLALAAHPDVLVVELGGNDFLMGLPLQELAANLLAIVEAAHAGGCRVLLAGLALPDGLLGSRRARDFEAVHAEVAQEQEVPLVPDLLEDVLGDPRRMQRDAIHPSAEGHRVAAENLLPHLRDVLEDLPAAR